MDNETGHQPDPQALGDDQDGNDDEDGVSLTSSLIPGQMATLEAILTVSSDIAEPVFTVLVDFDGNGQWTLDERVIQETATHGTHSFSFPVPQSATAGTTFMRAVLRDEGPPGPQGHRWGEIEDYQVDITQTEEVYDFGDAPDAYETYYNFGPYHSRTRGFCLGTSIDDEQDGQPTAMADGDDEDGTDDEDGVTFPLLQAGSPASVQIQVSAPLQQTVEIACWIDYDQNQTFDSGELVVHDYRNLSSSPETLTYMVPVPPSLTGDSTYARVRLFMGDDYEPLPTNFGGDGEVEDYVVYIASEDDTLDFGDAPIPYPPASHKIGGGWIGTYTDAPDKETGMQRHSQALGDDQDAEGDDEKGFLYTSDLVPGNIGLAFFNTWTPPSSKTSVCAWIDWNQDGDWNDANESIGCTIVDNSVSTTLFEVTIAPTIYIPSQAKTGPTFARIRLINGDQALHHPLSPGGHYNSGEVEDHLVTVKEDGDNIPNGSTLIGYKWNDLDGDGYWDQNPTPEPPLENWSIWLDENGNGIQDGSDPVVQTDANGFYHFDNLPDGTYSVGEEQQPGWTQTYPAGGGTHSIAVAVGHMIQSANFGNTQQETESSPLKWSQLPLFDPMRYDTTCYFGWDQLSIFSSDLAADDWFCFNPKPVTGIRWWGSYKNWEETSPPEDAPVEFHLGIWTDVPRGEVRDYSHPGKLIWESYIPRSAVNEHEVRCDFHPDHMQNPETCFLYEWSIPKEDWFFQEDDSTIYWLSVSAIYPEDVELKHPWGWTTRLHYFNDDAVTLQFNQPIQKGTDFEEGDPIASRWDLAFELMTTEYEWNLDYGDAPDPTFATSRVYNGAHHLMDPAIRLGDHIDAESDGLPGNQAEGDDTHNLDDDDGVRLLSGMRAGETAELQIDVSTAGIVNIWLDTERNGHWFDPPDHVVNNVFLSAGEHKLDIPIAGTAHIGEVFMRVRFSTSPGVWFNGFARDGEVEDYLVEIESSGTAVESESNLPTDYALYPNIPNPFNLSTRLEYDLPSDSPVRLAICNLVGQEIAVLVDKTQTAGHHSAIWNGLDQQGRPLPTGIYFCTLRAGDYKATQKLLLLK